MMTADPRNMHDFAEVYDRYFDRVYNYVRYRVEDDAAADDVASRVFEKALGRWETFDPSRGEVDAWLFAIARSAVMDHFRSKRWRSWLPLDLFPERASSEPASDAKLAEAESLDELSAALQGLDDRARDVLALKFEARMTNRAIAEQTGLGESHVAVLLFRSLKKLQAALKDRT
ncbi:MAG TPA: RNA polymerase subunit sigma-24 [Elusimicrobia bacterium]|nr:RNA polymerase subunit sigma-24 [Elusimicrobiota bacterium]